MHAPRLKRIAEETGGRFYTPETISGMPEDLRYTGRGVTTVEERELWHMPIVLMLFARIDLCGMGLSPRRRPRVMTRALEFTVALEIIVTMGQLLTRGLVSRGAASHGGSASRRSPSTWR